MAMRYGKVAISRRVLVNLTNGSAVEGVMWEDRSFRGAGLLVLRSAVLHEAGQHSPLDGEVIIDYDRILFLQAPEIGS